MTLKPMQPTPHTSDGKPFKVSCCACGCAVLSTEVLCDIDGKPWSFYCPACVASL